MSSDRTAMPKKGTRFVCRQRLNVMTVYHGRSIVVKAGDLVEVIDPTYCRMVRFRVKTGTEPECCVSHGRFYDGFVRASSSTGKQLLVAASLATVMTKEETTALVSKRTAEVAAKKERLKKTFGEDLVGVRPPRLPVVNVPLKLSKEDMSGIPTPAWPRVGDRYRCTKNVRLSAIDMFDYTVGNIVQVEGLELGGGYVRLMNPLTGERTPRVTKNLLDGFFTCIDRIEEVVAANRPKPKHRFDGCNGNVYELDVSCKPAELSRVVKPTTQDCFNMAVTASVDTMRVTGGWTKDMLTVATYEHKVGNRLVNVPIDGIVELLKRAGYSVMTKAEGRGEG